MKLLDSLPCAVLVTDRKGAVLASNSELARLLGLAPQRWAGTNIDDLLLPAGRWALQAQVWPALLRDGHISQVPLQVLTQAGQALPGLLSGRLDDWDDTPACYWTWTPLATGPAQADSQRLMRRVADAMPGMVAYWDRDLRCRFANLAHQAWYGQSIEQILATTLPELLGEAAYARSESHVLLALAGQPQQFERNVRRPDGSQGHLWVNYLPDIVDGQVQGLFVSANDVSALKAAEAALRTEMVERERMLQRLQQNSADLVLAQTRLQTLYEATPAMLQSVDPRGKLLGVSDAWLARLGYQRSQVLGRRALDFMTPASRRTVLAVAIPAVMATGRCDGVALQMRAQGGELVEVLLSAVLERDAQGQPLRGLVVIEDLTLRRQAERELAREHQRLQNLIDSTHAGTWEWHVPSGQIIVSERWAALLGWTRDALGPLHNDFRAGIAHPQELASTQALLRAHFAGRSDAFVADLRLRHRDGDWIWVEERGRLVSRNADGRPEWVFGILIDISQRKQAQEDLHRSQQLLQRTGEVAGVGGWQIDLASGETRWSSQMRRIHGLPDDFQPSLATPFAGYGPQARATLEAAHAAARSTGQGWDMVLPLLRADGRLIEVRSVGHVELEAGQPQRLVGALQDVTDEITQRRALRVAHQRMALATDSGGIGVWDLDLVSQTLTVDHWIVRLYQLPAGVVPAATALWTDQVHADDRAAAAQAAARAIASQRSLDTGFRIVWPDGSLRHIRLSARVTRDDHGVALALVGVCWDVTALRELTAEVARQHALLRVTLASISDAVITTDASGGVNWMNPVAERLTGWSASQALGQPLASVFNALDEQTRQPAADPVAACLALGAVAGRGLPMLLIARDGREHGIEESTGAIRSPQGDLLGVVLVFRDVSEQRRLSGEMSYRATHDALTGLVNRSEFEARLSRALRKAQDDGSVHALLYIDLDQFKLVNDACGHAIGDQLLQQIAKLLQAAVRSRDTLARQGGDEFAIILEHCDLAQARRVGQKICDQMDEFRFVHDDRRFRLGASIGLVPLDARWASTTALQQAADTACYAAKEAGRNRVHVWYDSDTAMQARQVEVQWTTRIERALDEGGFELYAQRLLPLRQPEAGLHAELLLRLVNADGSLALPSAFMPAAERFRLVTRVDRWVLGQALDWLQALAQPSLIASLSINLSGQSVGDRAFHAWAIARLEGAGRPASNCLCLEITETAAITHLADAAAFIAQVRALGVRVALDDFGAGASSFGYLKSLPVDLLKIDGQFVRNLVTDPLDAAAVRCFADVARVVGVKTVAECVETPDVLRRLTELGVDYAQGFLIHQPAPLACLLQPLPAPAPDSPLAALWLADTGAQPA